jgi:hypothetical protein
MALEAEIDERVIHQWSRMLKEYERIKHFAFSVMIFHRH